MTTVINNPPGSPEDSSGGGSAVMLIVGIFIAVVFVFLFVVYGLPSMRGAKNATEGGVTVPTTVQVPDKIDVNIKK
jgi:hypothetical protein